MKASRLVMVMMSALSFRMPRVECMWSAATGEPFKEWVFFSASNAAKAVLVAWPRSYSARSLHPTRVAWLSRGPVGWRWRRHWPLRRSSLRRWAMDVAGVAQTRLSDQREMLRCSNTSQAGPRMGIYCAYGAATLPWVICATECQVNRPDRT